MSHPSRKKGNSSAGRNLNGDTPLQNDHDLYSKATVHSLKSELKRRGLKLKGRKEDLISRLVESDRKMSQVEFRERSKTPTANANGDRRSSKDERLLEERKADLKEKGSIVIWRRPFTTLYYFFLELLALTWEFSVKLWRNKLLVLSGLVTFLFFLAMYHINGPHQPFVAVFRKNFLWCAYWVGLGVLSSVGLGTGLHTFLLYLGPHIAAVTLAAFECMSVDFPSPPYPDEIICPETEGTSMSIWTIISKVRLEAFMWGAGTAIGELPPYFMARAARLSGQIDEEEQELEELIAENRVHPSDLSFMSRAKIYIHDVVQKVGFMGILLCASIPNPLFDLAGITCGHFLVPFWTFFGATLIGKAIIKMHIQKIFVIFVFSEKHVEHVISLMKYIPYFGKSLQAPFKEYLKKKKATLHVTPGSAKPTEQSWLAWVFEQVVLLMVVYFVVSIVNSMAQNYHSRVSKNKRKKVSTE